MDKTEQTGTNFGMTEVILVEKAKNLKDTVLPTFSGVQPILVDSVKNLGDILDPTLLLEKCVDVPATKILSSD